MAETNTTKFHEMNGLLSIYKEEISKSAPNNLKCKKCKNILVNACQVGCGCQYCHDCVIEMIDENVKNCPGNTSDCKNELLEKRQFDYRANNEISKLIMMCPEKSCLHECILIDMEEHLKICDKKFVECPFYSLGCDDKKMAREKLNEHCHSANFEHSKILVKNIDDLKDEIKKLNEKLEVKDEIINSINEQVKSIKLEKENLRQDFESFKKNLENKVEEISMGGRETSKNVRK